MKPAEPVMRMVWLFCDIFCNEVKACARTSDVDDAKYVHCNTYLPFLAQIRVRQGKKRLVDSYPGAHVGRMGYDLYVQFVIMQSYEKEMR